MDNSTMNQSTDTLVVTISNAQAVGASNEQLLHPGVEPTNRTFSKRVSGGSVLDYINRTIRQSWGDEKDAEFTEKMQLPNTGMEKGLGKKPLGLESVQEVKQYLRAVVTKHEYDLNFPRLVLDKALEALEPGTPDGVVLAIINEISEELRLIEEVSPYAEVRAVIDSFDDPSMPVMTFRMWTIGLFLVVLGAGLNQFFTPRLPSIGLSVTFAQLVSYPIGVFMAKVLPTRIFTVANRSFTLNPGPFNKKEHMAISLMANVGFGGVYVTDIIAVLRISRFYNNNAIGGNLVFQITMALSSQLIGYTFAGLTRRFLVWPSSMVWWGNLLEISVLKALHSNENTPANGWRISQMRFFLICMIGYGVYFILPDVFFQSISFFNWTTWFAPQNVKLALITGTVTGLGLTPLPTLDWNFMNINPVVTPLWSIMNSYIGAICAFLAICIIYFKNMLFTAFNPINSNAIFDRFGIRYNTSAILNEEGILDQAKYEAYSPPFMSAANLVLYTAFFALYTASITHAVLYYRRQISGGFKTLWRSIALSKGGARDDEVFDDIHYKLMKAYPEVPEWWFLLVGLISTTMAIYAIEFFKTQMPVWGLVFAFAIALVMLVPLGIMSAVASTSVTLNVISEFVGGVALPGRPLANMLFKTYGYITLAQALGYAADLKLAHYAKIPPRATFWVQTVGTIVAVFVQIAVLNWQIDAFPDLCSPEQRLRFTCPGYTTFYSASLLWGAIGPVRLFTGLDAMYAPCLWGFLIGALLPIITWLVFKKWPRSWARLIHMPVFISGWLSFAPFNLGYLTPAIPLAIFFQRYVKVRFLPWYEKYALTLTAGLDAGIALFGLFYFFVFQFNGQVYSWVGNDIYSAGCDGRSCTLLKPPEAGFGPATWH